MKIIRVSKQGPRKSGPVKTSQKPLTIASPKRPGRTGEIATNSVMGQMSKSSSRSGNGGGKKRGRKAMY